MLPPNSSIPKLFSLSDWNFYGLSLIPSSTSMAPSFAMNATEEINNSEEAQPFALEEHQTKQKLLPVANDRSKLCMYASKTPLQMIDSFHGKAAIRRCDIYGFCCHANQIPDRPEVYCCQDCPNYFNDDKVPEEWVVLTDNNREEAIQVLNINPPEPNESISQEIKYKKVDGLLKDEPEKTIEVEYKDLSEISEQNLKDMKAMRIKPIDNIKPNVDELLGE